MIVLTGRTEEIQTSRIYLNYFYIKELISWGVAKPSYLTDIFKGNGKESPSWAETSFVCQPHEGNGYSCLPAICSIEYHFPHSIKREVESWCPLTPFWLRKEVKSAPMLYSMDFFLLFSTIIHQDDFPVDLGLRIILILPPLWKFPRRDQLL